MSDHSDEQVRDENGHFGVSWRTYVDALVAALQSEINRRVESIQRETETARLSMEKRLDGMNEFRTALKDQAHDFITRKEYDVSCKDIADLKKSRDIATGKASQNSVLIAYLLAAIAIAISFISMFVR